MNGNMVQTGEIKPLLESADKCIGNVYWTKDHSKFRKIEGNRAYSSAQLKKLKKSFETEQIITPIIVNEKYEIIDGQHRQRVLEELEMAVPYIVIKGLILSHIQMLNSYMQNWSLDDFLYCWVRLEIEPYLEFSIYKDNFKLSTSICIRLFKGRDSGGGDTDSFKEGTFNFTIREKERAYKYGSMLINLINQTNDPQLKKIIKSTNSVVALMSIFELKNYDHSIMCDRMSKYGLMYAASLSGSVPYCKKGYISLYNHRTRSENKISYGDAMTNEELRAA